MTIVLDGSGLTIDKLVRIARHGEEVELHPEALERIKICRAMLEEKIKAREIMYGVTTGTDNLVHSLLSTLISAGAVYNCCGACTGDKAGKGIAQATAGTRHQHHFLIELHSALNPHD